MLGKGPLFVGKVGNVIGGKDAADEREALFILHEDGEVRIAVLIFEDVLFDERGDGAEFLFLVKDGEGADALRLFGRLDKLFGGVEPLGEVLGILILRAFEQFGNVFMKFFGDLAEGARRGVGVHARLPRQKDALNALCRGEGGL